MIQTQFPTTTISSKRREDDKSMPDLCHEADINSSDVEEDTRSYLQLCFAIGDVDDDNIELTMGDESTNKSQQFFELSQTEDFYLDRNDDDVAPQRKGRKSYPCNLPTYHEHKAVEAKTSLNGKLSFRSSLRKARSVSLLAVECSATSSPFFDLDKLEKSEDSESDDDCCQKRGNRGVNNHFPSTSTHSTSSAGSVSQSIVHLRRKLKNRSTANRRPMWSSSLTSTLSSRESKKEEREAAVDDESCVESRNRRSRMSSAKSCGDVEHRSTRATRSSASCAEEKAPRSRRGSSASVQPPSSTLEPVVKSRRSSGSSVQGIITFVAEATSSHRRSPNSATQIGMTTLLARLPSSRVGRRSSDCGEAGDVDPHLLGAHSSSHRSSSNSCTFSALDTAQEEMLRRTRKVDVSSRIRERMSFSTLQ